MYFTLRALNFSCLLHSMMMSLLHLWGYAIYTKFTLVFECSAVLVLEQGLKKVQNVFYYNKSCIKHQRVHRKTNYDMLGTSEMIEVILVCLCNE